MLQIFKDAFSGTELLGQIFSILGMIITVLSFQCKERRQILVLQIIGNVLFLCSYLCLSAWSAVAMNVIYLIRNTVYIYKARCKWLDGIWTMLFFCVLCTAAGILTWSDPKDILPLLGALFGCVALYMNNETSLLAIKLGDSLCWLIYNTLSLVSGGIICEVCNLFSIAIGIIRRRRKHA